MLISVTIFPYIVPTVRNLDRKTSYPFKQKVNLGLDLQGGVYMVPGVDFRKVFGGVADRQAETISEITKGGPAQASGEPRGGTSAGDPRVTIECSTAQAHDDLRKFIKKMRPCASPMTRPITLNIAQALQRQRPRDHQSKHRSDPQPHRRVRCRTVITSQGTDRLSVELPGIKDVERAKESSAAPPA